jgi:6-pyruvoyltetrahydropterin/6-carboxytetrahydropterin synthase
MNEVCCISRKYHFSAGHRLYFQDSSDLENFEIFGKCSNPRGHGHDYYLEVKIKGEIDKQTGRIINLSYLDNVVNNFLLELDYKRLDKEVKYFTEIQPTGENIVIYLWDKLKEHFSNEVRVMYMKLWETDNNYFEYFEEGDSRYEN